MESNIQHNEVAQASRILFAHGLVDAFGHVSQRHSVRTMHFLMSRSMAPGLVDETDVLEHDENGELVTGSDGRPFLERFIHAEIYRARPDVNAIVHSHSPSVLPFTVVPEVRLRPLGHMCGFLAAVGRPFEISDFAGPASDLLIRDAKLGEALARHLGADAVVLMRGHGFTAVGANIREAVFRAIYTGSAAQLQVSALQLGVPRYLTDEEAAACAQTTSSQQDRAWNLWVAQLNFQSHPRNESLP